MKIKLFFLATLGILFFAACEQELNTPIDFEDEELQPQQINMLTGEIIPTISWDELPEEIRNAEYIDPEGFNNDDLEADSRSGCHDFMEATPAPGGHGGAIFVTMPMSTCDKVHAVAVNLTGSVRQITFFYITPEGRIYKTVPSGELNGNDFGLHLFKESEVIVSFTTHSKETVNGFGFTTQDDDTNQQISSVFFGTKKGTPMNYASNIDGKVLGIFGEAGQRVNKLGAFFYRRD